MSLEREANQPLILLQPSRGEIHKDNWEVVLHLFSYKGRSLI